MKKSTHSLLAIRGIVFKTIAVLLVVCLLLPISAFAASDTTKENGSSPVETEIQELLDERASILNEMFLNDEL